MLVATNQSQTSSNNDHELAIANRTNSGIVTTTRPRKSGLFSETMLLAGQEGAVYSIRFNPKGQTIASAGHDKLIYLWEVYGETPRNYSLLKGHTKDILEVHWDADGVKLYSASADHTIVYWDAEAGTKIKKINDHQLHVNSCCPVRRGPELLCSASDDSTSKLFDLRVKGATATFQHECPVTSVCFSDQADQVITGGLDNIIRVWDIRKNQIVFELTGHTDTVTGLSLSPDGAYLLSNSMDCYLRVWDIRPFCEGERCRKIFMGHQHNLEKALLRCSWSPDGTKISAGSSDKFVYVWDTTLRQIKYKLPGHNGIVSEVVFHPTEPIIASCSHDKQIFLGEIE